MAASTPALSHSDCFHCAAACPPGTRWRARVDGAERVFCCAGCLAVAHTIAGAGLDAWYRQRAQQRSRQRPPPVASGRTCDDVRSACAAAEVAGLVRVLADSRHEVALLVEGMTCGACVVLIERWLARQPGVDGVAVNFTTRRARVTFDPAHTRLAAIAEAAAAIGYRAYPYDPARRESLARRETRALFARMSIAWLAMMQVMMFAVPVYFADDSVAPEQRALLDWASLALTLPVMLYSAAPFFRDAW